MKKIKNFIASRNKRERIMMAGILFCALAIWASSMMTSRSEIDMQKIDLDKRMLVAQTAIKMEANIVERLKKLEAEIDKTKTLSPDDLQIAIENAAKEAELDYSISNVTTTPVGEFKVNKIILTTTPQELYVIAKFESLLAKLEPYVAVAESTLTGDKQGKASVRYIISSFN